MYVIKFEKRIYFFFLIFTVTFHDTLNFAFKIIHFKIENILIKEITLDVEVLWYRVHKKILPLAYTCNAEIITSTYKLCHNNYDRTFPLKIIYDSYYVLWIWFLPLIHDYIQFVLCTTNLVFSIKSMIFFIHTHFCKKKNQN